MNQFLKDRNRILDHIPPDTLDRIPNRHNCEYGCCPVCHLAWESSFGVPGGDIIFWVCPPCKTRYHSANTTPNIVSSPTYALSPSLHLPLRSGLHTRARIPAQIARDDSAIREWVKAIEDMCHEYSDKGRWNPPEWKDWYEKANVPPNK